MILKHSTYFYRSGIAEEVFLDFNVIVADQAYSAYAIKAELATGIKAEFKAIPYANLNLSLFKIISLVSMVRQGKCALGLAGYKGEFLFASPVFNFTFAF
ncbi:MAG: hypothetical protein JSV93_01585 [Candidatus Omnitrophota bacterium]|nr:MAG: hypothetical protein JSV93_01585 [Candidatus Omnitrophota bacterium]